MERAAYGIQIGGDIVQLAGSDRAKWLHNFCTADIKALTPGDSCEAFILNSKGKVSGWVQVFCRAETLDLLMPVGTAPAMLEHFERYVIREDVSFEHVAAPTELFFLWGAEAGDAFRESTGCELIPGKTSQTVLNGQTILATPIEMIGPGILVEVAAQSLSDPEAWFSSTGFEVGDSEDLNLQRILHRAPRWGTDFNDDYLPQELRRDDLAISFTKGCYLGQETVARIDALGHVNRFLAVIALTVPPEHQWNLPVEVTIEQQKVGSLTSVAQDRADPQLWFGLATLKRTIAKPGQKISIGEVTGSVVDSQGSKG
ncbi:MAG: hypothetical protein KF851_14665 [Pirellulaceae bacterium]|nr:hypothetical protein [Pirellulaceae bacterium]